ncbi:FAD:protein FMN transferase [Porticoccus sp. W117]|uniref:FAD:protein FMN transferase n=1 Tax=Porticoccus sp. W117 TaxID=3054777 RepID=UPI0025936686|nr:FAD:protein FMN transferase [Porticoccus sp. W117]MDM3869753.1 FAD:protein FMN transferase [Porticoccus sp. W117]
MPRFLLILLLFSPAAWCQWHSDTQAIMGTEVRVMLWHAEDKQGRAAVDAVMAEMQRIDAAYNPWDKQSELYRVNLHGAKGLVSVSAEMIKLLDKGLYYGRLTDGAFDITFASVGHGYDYRTGKKATQQQHNEAVIDYRLVTLDRQKKAVRFGHPNIKVDLGGIAKGYAIDRAVELLGEQGIEHASISAGGDTRLLGDRRGRPWVAGIKNPRGTKNEIAIKLPLQDEALSTSGDYERFFIDENGERIHHILNPKTGYSANGITSVSVIGPNGFDTDPLSTSVFVMGVEKGLQLINSLADFEAIIIDEYGMTFYSQGLGEP